MYCKDCKVEVIGDNKVCPLCHKELDGEKGEKLFPDIKKSKRDFRKKFTKIYEWTSLAVFLIFVVLNYFFIKNFLYDAFVLTIIISVYFITRFAFLGSISFGARGFLVSAFLSLLLFETEYIYSVKPYSVSYVLPILNMLNYILLWIYCLFANESDKRTAHLSLLAHGFFGLIIPIIYAVDSNLFLTTIPFILSTALSVLNLLVVLSLHFKEILIELKKRFHA